jgi:hypothetical protein
MSRNMIKANLSIFSALITFVEKSKISEAILPGKRFIKTNEEEKRWLKELNCLKQQPILPNLITASIEFDSQEYFVVIGWEKNDVVTFAEQEVITPIELNAGIVTALLFELKVAIRPKVKPYYILDEVLYPIQSDYSGHEFEVVSDCFEPLLVYQIVDNSPLKGEKIERLSGFYLSKNCEKLFLKFSQDTLLVYEKLFLEASESVPYENLVLSLTSVYWKYSFLDVYRCIERIFSISRLDELCQKLNIVIPLLQLSAEMENSLGWKPKEDETLNKLIEGSPEEARQLFREVKKAIYSQEEGSLGEFFYKIRNSIVHYRPANQEFKLDDENWDKLIRGALLVILYWYQEYDSKLF